MFSLSGISDFVSTYIDENLKKPLHPSGLFASIILVMLNLIFVIPVLFGQFKGAAAFIRNLGSVWWGMLIAVLIVTISYVLLSIRRGILKLFTGELWADSPGLWRFQLVPWLRRRQKRKLDRLPTLEKCDKLKVQTGLFRQLLKYPDDLDRAIETIEEELEKLEQQIQSSPEGSGERDRLNQQKEVLQETLARLQGIKEIQQQTEDKKSNRQTTGVQMEIARLLQKGIDELNQQYAQCLQKRWEGTTMFSAEEGHLAPTALGNALNATASLIWQRYRMDMTVLWPYIERTVAKQDEKNLYARITNDKAALDFLLNMAFVLVVFSVEYSVVSLLFEVSVKWSLRLVPIITLILAYFVFYRAAVGQARAWGLSVQMAFDLYRDELRKGLGLREPKDRAHMRGIWEEASRWLVWGTCEEQLHIEPRPEDGLFEKDAAEPPTIRDHSENVKCSLMSAKVEEPEPLPGSQLVIKEYINHLLVVSNAVAGETDDDCHCWAEGIYVVVSDPRVPVIEKQPELEDLGGPPGITVKGQPVPADRGRHHLLWYISHLPPNSAVVLRYKLLLRAAKTNCETLKISKADFKEYDFEITNEGDPVTDAQFRLLDSRALAGTLPKYALFVAGKRKFECLEIEKGSGSYVWKLGQVKRGDVAALHCHWNDKED